MTVDEMYQDMKRALDFFGLRFHEMASVSVYIAGDKLVYAYNGETISVSLPTVGAERKPLPIPTNPTPL